MSKTYIPKNVRNDLWIAAAGRCEFRGCNTPINKNFITQERVLLGEYCHIIADSSAGPRGNKLLSKKLAQLPSNLILCCPICHKTIDDSILQENYSAEMLREMKASHEVNIQKIYDSTNVRNGIVVILYSRINDTISQITLESSQYAILQNSDYSIFPSYPPEVINLSCIKQEESSQAYYQAAKDKIRYRISSIKDRMSDSAIEHLDVFALAQIPLLMYLGYLIGDRVDCTIYQAQRKGINKWLWPKTTIAQRPQFSFSELPHESITSIAIVMSISATINHDDVISQVADMPIVDFFVNAPSAEVVDHPDIQHEFSVLFRSLISTIFTKYRDAEIHLFPAIPNSLAIEMGRCIHPHALNPTWIWNRVNGSFIKAMKLQDY